MSKKTGAFILGSLFGVVAGVGLGMLLAPRSGAETRAMATDAMNDAWDSAVDSYERGSAAVSEKLGNVGPAVDAKTDELRAKVDLARERMDQLRDSLSDAVAAASEQVEDTVGDVIDEVSVAAAEAAAEADQTAATGVRVEVVVESGDAAEPAEA